MIKYEMMIMIWIKKIKKIRKLIISIISFLIMIYIENIKDLMEIWVILKRWYKLKIWVILYQFQYQFNIIKIINNNNDIKKYFQKIKWLKW